MQSNSPTVLLTAQQGLPFLAKTTLRSFASASFEALEPPSGAWVPVANWTGLAAAWTDAAALVGATFALPPGPFGFFVATRSAALPTPTAPASGCRAIDCGVCASGGVDGAE